MLLKQWILIPGKKLIVIYRSLLNKNASGEAELIRIKNALLLRQGQNSTIYMLGNSDHCISLIGKMVFVAYEPLLAALLTLGRLIGSIFSA